MAKTSAVNQTAQGAWSYGNAAGDAFAKEDVQNLGKNFDLHDHSSTKGLPVTRGDTMTITGGVTISSGVLALPVSSAGPNKTITLVTDNGGGVSELWTNTVGGQAAQCVVRFDVANGVASGKITTLTLTGGGSVIAGVGGLANGATDGFLYVPMGGGAPSGTPTAAATGQVPIRFNTADNKLYCFINSAWKASAAFA